MARGKGERAMGNTISEVHPELIVEWSERNSPLVGLFFSNLFWKKFAFIC